MSQFPLSLHSSGRIFCISDLRMKSHALHQLQDQAGQWAGDIYQKKAGKKVALILT
jgi:hypothetical protein